MVSASSEYSSHYQMARSLTNGRILTSKSYGHQRQLVIAIDGYAWIVPFVTDGERIFFKTFFPSRKATKSYLGG